MLQNGIGKHETHAKKPSRHARAYAFAELYPPMQLKITPPMMTPDMGAERQVKA